MTQPAMTQPAMTQPAMTQPAMTQPIMSPTAVTPTAVIQTAVIQTVPPTDVTKPTPAADASPPHPGLLPPDLFMDVILGLLAPLLMTSGITDASLARLAARQAIAAYKAAGEHELVCIAQIVGFAMTALDNLRLSMPADLSLSVKLKLRGNANALTRSSQGASATLLQQRKAPKAQHQPPAAPLPAAIPPAAIPPAAPLPAATRATATLPAATPQAEPSASTSPTPSVATRPTLPEPRPPHAAWAGAMTDIAAECAAELPHLPASQRQAKLTQISALTKTADALRQAPATPLRSRLLGSTSLQR